MDLKLDSTEMREIIGEALLRAVDEKTREALIASALRSLLERDGNSYDKKSPLERAFAYATQQMAHKTAEEMLVNDAEFKAGIEAMIAEAAAKVIGEGRAEMVDKIAKAISSGLEPKYR